MGQRPDRTACHTAVRKPFSERSTCLCRFFASGSELGIAIVPSYPRVENMAFAGGLRSPRATRTDGSIRFGIMAPVRRALAAIVISMVGFILTADPFCCADGCTNGEHAAVSATATSCSLCQSSVAVPTVPTLTRGSVVRPMVSDPPTMSVLSPAHRIEHPPRLA